VRRACACCIAFGILPILTACSVDEREVSFTPVDAAGSGGAAGEAGADADDRDVQPTSDAGLDSVDQFTMTGSDAAGDVEGGSACGVCSGMTPVCLGSKCVACSPSSTRCNRATPQTCNTAGIWVDGQVTQGMCGAVCTQGALRCTTGIGQLCGGLGTWDSNGSAVPCKCYVPGRFTSVGAGLVLDSTTGLTWDVSMRMPTDWPAASTKCRNEGMRLPTQPEWQSVILLDQSNNGTPTCMRLEIPFDAAAMPTTTADFAAGGSANYKLWTASPEPGFPSNVVVQILTVGGSPPQWALPLSDDLATSTTISHPYRCVK
jgi:hypothetical protein